MGIDVRCIEADTAEPNLGSFQIDAGVRLPKEHNQHSGSKRISAPKRESSGTPGRNGWIEERRANCRPEQAPSTRTGSGHSRSTRLPGSPLESRGECAYRLGVCLFCSEARRVNHVQSLAYEGLAEVQEAIIVWSNSFLGAGHH